ncbi:NAD(P)-dependent alcohol dehydrogenase [Paracrocinitomix mangrovi]|uniref:NAD(P)-dependent alcohol dehydrogenase n=1 Tax=Paracrocinitomix mangrovi TaxID=2862509 RepID=UPI001C8E804E|nr:NAD(P)-dependent alcohol dehydrogenase [Paracrocinitomix mangrovi]UKN00456.1 NAD(P)-dependent alcohol dehydrogenase [Paracrocinitomix mangrovi]
MKSIIVNAYGGPEVLKLKNTEKPTPKSNEVLIKIQATSVTRASTMMRTGTPYFGRLFTGISKPKVKTPGTDLAGIVEAIGAEVTNFQVGEKVIAATDLKCGAYAEYICMSENEMIVHQPENISAEEATGIVDGGSTAIAFLTEQVTIKAGDKVLINGASGSIGSAAIQLAKEFGAEVTAVCSGKNSSLVKELGADQVLDYTKNELANNSEQFDVIFDTVGKLSFRKAKKNLSVKGVYLTPVMEFPTLMHMLFINPFSKKKLKFAATGLRKQDQRMRDLLKITDLLANNKLKTVIDKVYTLEQIQDAHKYVDAGHKRGNVIIKVA